MKDKINVKIKTENEAFWTDVLEKTSKEIEQLKRMLKFNEAILKMAEQYIQKEKEKLKGGKKNG